ncbi:hypothetical protein SGFS_013230 [Streptomyces graminofaciens]|uniref:Uncharacterized protein n=1 Tax=Streptomyces graminofaciens TaxID=68212 RepID=A0ABN5VA19_9ACTN|nr:hypothetical protein [Streptomyces graminofaciens]BBC30029.1 hypothetical protein SGFS_013230 [Streptomyces graminofaciens]
MARNLHRVDQARESLALAASVDAEDGRAVARLVGRLEYDVEVLLEGAGAESAAVVRARRVLESAKRLDMSQRGSVARALGRLETILAELVELLTGGGES